VISVLALDIDGVLTDGRVTLDDAGRELKTLSYRDIDAISLAQSKGLRLVLVTGEESTWVDMIARRLKISVYKGAKDKHRALQTLCSELGIDLKQVCYVGDSARDLPGLKIVELGLVPADALLASVPGKHRVLEHPGGNGAVAEAIEIVLEFQKDADGGTERG